MYKRHPTHLLQQPEKQPVFPTDLCMPAAGSLIWLKKKQPFFQM